MKKTITLLALLALAATLAAKPVDTDRAMNVARAFLQTKGVQRQLADITAQTGLRHMHVLAIDGGGFVVVPADDATSPILAYSTTNDFGTRGMPANIRWWLGQYEAEIAQRAKAGGTPDAMWATLEDGGEPTPLTTAVAPLMATTWNQSPYYNELCPYDSEAEEHAVTGCVATATAQIMKYWNWPDTGYGNHSYVEDDFGTLGADFGSTAYAWATMPNALTSVSSAAQVNAVATLMLHVGIADEMDYSVEGSGAHNYSYDGRANTACSQNSLVNYFRYRPDMRAVSRDRYPAGQWTAMLMDELDQSRPILYSGSQSSGGHSFVVDGYDDGGLFHVNWGWGGSCDGYFLIGNLNPSSPGTGANPENSYNGDNVALIGIRPHTSWGTGTTVTVGAATGGTATGGGTYAFLDTVTLSATANEGYRFMHWDDQCNILPRSFLATGGNYAFTAQFAHLGGDTISYCMDDPMGSALGGWEGMKYWGIRLPASVLTAGRYLNAAQLYVDDTGTYTMAIYTGVAAPTDTVVTITAHFTTKGWKTFPLLSPYQYLDPTKSIWITFGSDAGIYPATLSYDSGNEDGMLWDTDFTSNYSYFHSTFMIRGIFGDAPATFDLNTATCEILTFPYTQDFEGDMECWDITDLNDDGETWQILAGNGVDGSRCAQIHYADYAQDDLATPYIATPGDYTLNWKAKIRSDSYPETYSVLLVGDESTQLFGETLASTDYVDRMTTFTVNPGDTVRLVFHYTSDDMWYLYLDNIEIVQNSVFVQQYTVTVISADTTMGTVNGGGTFDEGATITISATPNDGYLFASWNDGSNDNPRSVTVSADTTYIASFQPIPDTVGIDGTTLDATVVAPNPATDHINISGPIQGMDIALIETKGRMLKSIVADGRNVTIPTAGLPAGVYYLRIGTATRKVVVK